MEITMRLRPDGREVKVYAINGDKALIFDPVSHMRDQGGWKAIKLNKLVPMDYPVYTEHQIASEALKKAKERLELIDATWKTSDGQLFKHDEKAEAIKVELSLMNIEKEGE